MEVDIDPILSRLADEVSLKGSLLPHTASHLSHLRCIDTSRQEGRRYQVSA